MSRGYLPVLVTRLSPCTFRQLDLSFNRLRKIEGLENLTKLRRLYLVNNKIGRIENIAHLTQLEMLELGDNKIRVSESDSGGGGGDDSGGSGDGGSGDGGSGGGGNGLTESRTSAISPSWRCWNWEITRYGSVTWAVVIVAVDGGGGGGGGGGCGLTVWRTSAT